MLFVTTTVLIADNTEGAIGLCIGILGSRRKLAISGIKIVISVKKILLNRKIVIKKKKKVKKGGVYQVIVLRTSYWRRRRENFFFKNSSNAVAVLGN
jgi:ribosomal protein L14